VLPAAVTCTNSSSTGSGITYTWYVDGASYSTGFTFSHVLDPGDHSIQLKVSRTGSPSKWSNTEFVSVT
jgi:hypothetical protein